MKFCCRLVLVSGLCMSALANRDLPRADSDGKSGDPLAKQAAEMFEKGQRAESFSLLTRGIESDPFNSSYYYIRGRFYALDRQHEKAITDFGQVLKLNAKAALAFQYRGEENFKLGHITESIADFDKYLELSPADRPQHWQRGIALYYAGRYEDGRKQFELHQAVNPSDVENAVWHFLCVARGSGVDQARGSLIRIEGDRRIPMTQIHALFAGKGSADDVIKAVNAGSPSLREMNQRLFYAHLYLGLYYEAMGERRLAQEHIFKAAEDYTADHYMGDVARVHARMLHKQSP